MEVLSLSAIGLGLAAVGETMASGITGNYAHEWCRDAIRSIAERAKAGELLPNHVLLRAARRSHLHATLFCVAQYRVRLRRQPEPAVRHLLRWCDLLEAWLRAEIVATRDDDYAIGAAPLSAQQAAMLVQRANEGDSSRLRDGFAADVLAALDAELKDWHRIEIEPRRLVPDLPEEFMLMLAEGWALEDAADRPAWGQLLASLKRRRGAGAAVARRMGEKRSERGGASPNVTWFAVYAAHFADEVGSDRQVHAAFTNKLLSSVALNAASPSVTTDELASQITGALRELGVGVTSHVDKLRLALEAGNADLLDALVQARDAAARDRILLERAASSLARIEARSEHIAAGVADLKELVAGSDRLAPASGRPIRRRLTGSVVALLSALGVGLLIVLGLPWLAQQFDATASTDGAFEARVLESVRLYQSSAAPSLGNYCLMEKWPLVEKLADVPEVRQSLRGEHAHVAVFSIVRLAREKPRSMERCLKAFLRAGWNPNTPTHIPVGITFRDAVQNGVAPKGYVAFLEAQKNQSLGSNRINPENLKPNALLLAVWQEDTQLVRALIAAGADPRLKNNVVVHAAGTPRELPMIDAFGAAQLTGNTTLLAALGGAPG